MIKVTLILSGCDDENRIDMAVGALMLERLQEIAKATVQASQYNCQPTMRIELRD